MCLGRRENTKQFEEAQKNIGRGQSGKNTKRFEQAQKIIRRGQSGLANAKFLLRFRFSSQYNIRCPSTYLPTSRGLRVAREVPLAYYRDIGHLSVGVNIKKVRCHV